MAPIADKKAPAAGNAPTKEDVAAEEKKVRRNNSESIKSRSQLCVFK